MFNSERFGQILSASIKITKLLIYTVNNALIKETYVVKSPNKQPKRPDHAIAVKGLKKSFKDIEVLRGVSFKVARGTIMALLGPNGAGKTTTVRILSTLLNPDGGEIKINGYDVVRKPDEVRASIGLTGQYAAVDQYLSGEENLLMIGRLYRLSHKDVRQRTAELLELFDLKEASGRPVKTYSGGMKRRIDLAMSLIASPPVIFLDEPTTGLDPRSRLMMWGMIRKLADSGTTILLTTQYMDEADYLADNIVVIDNGEVIAEGSSDLLKAKVGSDYLDVVLPDQHNLKKAQKYLKDENLQINTESGIISVATEGGVGKLKRLLQQLEDAKIEVDSVSLRRPTLDDVFLSLTGHGTKDESEEGKQ